MSLALFISEKHCCSIALFYIVCPHNSITGLHSLGMFLLCKRVIDNIQPMLCFLDCMRSVPGTAQNSWCPLTISNSTMYYTLYINHPFLQPLISLIPTWFISGTCASIGQKKDLEIFLATHMWCRHCGDCSLNGVARPSDVMQGEVEKIHKIH